MTVELFGMARALTGRASVEVDVAPPATLRKLLEALARAHPELVGQVLAAGSCAPLAPHHVLLDGRRAASLDETLVDGDRPCLIVLPSGG